MDRTGLDSAVNGSGFSNMTPMGRNYGMNGATVGPALQPFDLFRAAPYRGPFASAAGTDGASPGGTAAERVGTPYRGIGKTNIALPETGPPPSASTPFQGLAPRSGIAESLIGGLTEQFTGVLPGFLRDPLVGLAHGVGQVLDVPLELAGHIPLPWVPDVTQAFDRLPQTAQTAQIKQLALSDPDTALRYMAQYIRQHEQEYMEALRLPRILSPLMMPDANILERAMGVLGMPQQMVARTFAGTGLRDVQGTILNAPANSLPAPLEELRQRRLSGDLTQDQFLDEITQAGFALTNDPFANFFLSMATDPIIVGSMGTGAALGIVERGPLALRTARALKLIADENPELHATATAQAIARAAGDVRTASPITPLEQATEQATALAKQAAAETTKAPRGRAGAFNEMVRRNIEGLEPGVMGDALRRAEDTLTRRQRTLVRAEPLVRGMARVAQTLNEPFRVFGTDRAADLVGALRSDGHARGVMDAYGYGNLRAVAKAAGVSVDRLTQSGGTWMANSEMSLIHRNSMVKLIKSTGDIPAGLEEATPNARIREVSLMAPDVLVNESKRHALRAMPTYVLDTSHIADAAEAARLRSAYRTEQEAIAARRFMSATGMSQEAANKLVKGASDKRLALAEGLSYGRSIIDMMQARNLDANVIEEQLARAQAAGDAAEVARLTATRDLIKRYTLLGARELSLQDAKTLLDTITSGAPDAANVARQAIDRYDVLNQNFERMFDEDGRLVEDSVLIDRLATWLRDNIAGGENGASAFPSELGYADLPANLKSFIDQSRQVNGEADAYRLAVAPAAEDQWRVTHDTTGRLVGVNPWVEVSSEQAPMFLPRTWDQWRNTLFSPIRGERLLYEARARFVRDATSRWNISRRDSISLFEAVRKTASEMEVQPRGLTVAQFRGVVDGVAKGTSNELRQKLGDDGLTLLTARAFEGDMATVGVTSKITGRMKTRSAGWGNWVGVVAERLYPMMRFTANPIFQMQEWLEPYFFNIVRGVKPAMQWTPEDRAMLAMLDRWKLGTMFNDQAEYAYVSAEGWANTHKPQSSFGPGGQIAIANEKRMRLREVRDRKLLNYIRDTKADGGQQFKRSVLDAAPAQWAQWEQHYGTTDAGDIAVRLWMDKGQFHPTDEHYQTFLATGFIPHALGKPHRVEMPILARTLGYRDPIALRKAIKDGGLTEAQFRAHPVVGSFEPEFLDRSWATANFPSPDEWFGEYAKHMRKAGEGQLAVDVSIATMRNMAEAAATVKGVGLDEYLATRFAGKPVWVDSQRELPRAAYAQTIGLMRDDIDKARQTYAGGKLGALPEKTSVIERAYKLLAGGREATPVMQANATIRNAERAALGDGIPQMDEGILDVGTESFPMGFATDNNEDMLNSLATTAQETGPYPGSYHHEVLDSIRTVTQLLSDEEAATLVRQNVRAHERIGMLPVPQGFVPELDPTKPIPGIGASDQQMLRDELWLYGHDGQGGGGLWHTTTATEPVTEQGLRSRRDVGALGLGGGPDNAVSLTYDEAHADLIRERQKVFVRAARGEITGDEVWDHFISTEWEHLYQRPYDALRTLDPQGDFSAPHWKNATDTEWRKAQRYFAREWDARVAAGENRENWHMIQRADSAAHRMQGHWNNYNLQQGERERIGGIIVVGGDAAFKSHAAIAPESIRTVQVATRAQPRPMEWVPGEHELRVYPEDIATLGDVESATSRVQGTMQDMRSEVAARMFAGYVRALDSDIGPASVIQQMGDVLHDVIRRQKADPTGTTAVDHELVSALMGDWTPGPVAPMSTYARDVMDQTLSSPKVHFRRSAGQPMGATVNFTVGSNAAAMDRHALHALGYWTPEYANAIARRMVKVGDATDMEDALGQLSSKAGYDVRRPNPNAADPEVEYERAAQKANQLADAANYESWQGRSDWTAGDMASLASAHGRRIAGMHQSEAEGGTLLRKALVTEVSPGFQPGREWPNPMPEQELTHQPGSTLESTLPQWDDLTDQQMRDISKQVATVVQQFVEEATGVRFVGAPIDIVMPRGGGAAAVSPATGWSIMALSDEAVDSAMDMLGHNLQLDEVWGTKHTDALTADPARNIHWALDLRLPPTASKRHWDALMRYVAEAYPDGTRLLAARDGEGRQVARMVWAPDTGVAQTTLDDFLAGMREAEAGIEDELGAGGWTSGLPDEFDWMRETSLPVTMERHPVQVKVASNRGEGYPSGSTFEHQSGLARERVRREGISPEEAADGEIGRTYLDRLRSRGSYGAEVAGRVVGGARDQTKQIIDDAYEQYAADLAGPAAGRARLASLGGGARGEVTQFQRGPRGVRGAVSYAAGQRATLHVLKDVDASTGVHEMAHVFARDLDESGRRAIMDAYEAQPSRAGKRRWKNWNSHHEEYLAQQFEHYVAGGSKLAPTPALKATFNAFGEWGRRNLAGGVKEVPGEVKGVFDQWFKEADQTEPKATFNVDEYRYIQSMMQFFTRAEEAAHKRNYYARGRSWTERSINHPYLGMYPASYMWGKVLPAMVRFLVAKPFGVDAPLAGLEMAKHASFYTQLMIQTNPDLQQFIEDHPESVRFFALMLPGTPWDIPVNLPAWARHAAEDEAQNRLRVEQGLKPQATDWGRIIADTVAYAFGGRSMTTPINMAEEWTASNPTPAPDSAANVWSRIGL